MKPDEHEEIVLIVEDDADTAEALAEFLNIQGYGSIVAKNGQDAIDLLRSGKRPCLVLLDIMMPVKNGWDFRAEVLSDPSLSSIPIVIVTADMAAVTKAVTLRLPLLRKPVDTMQLIAEVERYC